MATMFIVRRISRGRYEFDDVLTPQQRYSIAVANRAAAVELACKLDREAILILREYHTNPFHPRFEAATSMPEPVLRDWLQEASIEPPQAYTSDAWAAWWTKIVDPDQGGLSDDQVARVVEVLNLWPLQDYEIEEVEESCEVPVTESERFDEIPLYDDVKLVFRPDLTMYGGPLRDSDEPAPDKVYAVVKTEWTYDDDHHYGEFGALKVFRTKQGAYYEYERLVAARLKEDPYHPHKGEFDIVELPYEPPSAGE